MIEKEIGTAVQTRHNKNHLLSNIGMEKSRSLPPSASASPSPAQRNPKIRSVDELKRFGIGLDYNIAMNTEEFALESILNDNLKEFSAKICARWIEKAHIFGVAREGQGLARKLVIGIPRRNNSKRLLMKFLTGIYT